VELGVGLSSITQPYPLWVNVTLQQQPKGTTTWEDVISQTIDVAADESHHIYEEGENDWVEDVREVRSDGPSIKSGTVFAVDCFFLFFFFFGNYFLYLYIFLLLLI
jgi:hypothetical protein